MNEEEIKALQKQVKQIQKEYDILDGIIDIKDAVIAELKAENNRLKEEIEIRDNLSEKFRKEALSWANIANEYQKDKTKLEQTLQQIKELINTCMEFRTCERCKFFKMCDKDLEGCILSLITKAEEE